MKSHCTNPFASIFISAWLLLLLTVGCTTASPQPTITFTPPPPSETPQPVATQTRTSIPSLTPTPAVASVHINPSVTYQVMDGFGADCWTFPYANDIEWNWEAVKYVFDELDIAYIRLAPWLGWWETANDNEDPFTLNWGGFGSVNDIINQHDVPFAQYLHQRGIELAVGVWDFGGVGQYCEDNTQCPDWLAGGDPRAIPPELYPEMGESVSAYILNMQKNGVPIPAAEVQNEPDIQAGIQYPNPEALRDAGKALLEMLDHYGLENVMLHGPNLHSPTGNVRWIEPWLADETLRQRTAAVSYHTWWSEDQKDYEEIWQVAQKYDKPVWATEAGYSGNATSIDPQNWLTVFGFAESYYRAIAWSHANRVYHWALLGFDGAVGKQGERYPMLYAIKHFANYIPPGAALIDSQSDDRRLRTLAFALPDGGYTVIVLNTNRTPRAMTLSGLDVAPSVVIVSSEKSYEVEVTPGADGVILLPPLSVASIRLNSPSPGRSLPARKYPFGGDPYR